eukprot:TRINITY_DN741_c0_g1_i1.p1 TRINITY_DN741_c0_g1~~TRINITY_DN741_c0_g1_i1.p1  ORF type:complete len:1692 (+),score=255.49 TRINITY_DN741_c0_g1_i1:147-5222(+)
MEQRSPRGRSQSERAPSLMTPRNSEVVIPLPPRVSPRPSLQPAPSSDAIVEEDTTPAGGPVRLNIQFTNVIQDQVKRLTPRRRGKHDYHTATKERPFHFEESSVDLDPGIITIPPDDLLLATSEPDEGAMPPMFDKKKHEKSATSVVINEPNYVPYTLATPLPPLRPPDKVEEKEKITDITAITAKRALSACTFIKLVNQNVKIKGFPKLISAYLNLSVLIIRGAGLKKVDDFNIPKLQYLDLSENAIEDAKTLLVMLKKSPYIESIKMKGNPVAFKNTYRGKVIGNCGLYLKALDETKITIEERMAAIEEWGPKNMKSNLGGICWDLNFSATQEVKGMQKWSPQQIVLLNLPKCNLSTINVAPLVNLEYLDLSKNVIKELRGLGLERCTALQHLNLKNNLISENKADLNVLSYLLSLRYLLMKGNPVATSPHYRVLIIYFTKFLRGNNRTFGLLELDEQPITIDERIAALSTITSHNLDIDQMRWSYHRLKYFGLKQSSTPEIARKIQNCVIPKSKLAFVDLSPFRGLQYLDLSRNNIREIIGLELLEHLRYLNMCENPRLRWQEIVSKQIKNLTTLESVSFMVISVPGHQCSPDNKKYRMTVLRDLLNQNLQLLSVDEITITPLERVDAYKMMKGSKPDKVERYRFDLAVTIDATPAKGRKYHPSQVDLGAQYEVKSIFTLSRLCSMGLVSSAVDLSPFVNLEEVNLASNKITDVTTIGLQSLKKLRVLDVSYNSIAGNPKKLAPFIDLLRSLECIALRGNPAVKNWPEDRQKLIGSLACMKEVQCKLQVIDYEVTIAERISAREKYSGPKRTLTRKGHGAKRDAEEHAEFKRDVINFLRVPQDMSAEALTLLDLHDCGLDQFDVKPYPSLDQLVMRSNHFKKLENIRGLQELRMLSVLDLRDNLFSKMDEIVVLVRQHLCNTLVSLGISGNKFSASKDYRTKFLKQIPELHERRFALNSIDDQIITVDEICSVWGGTSKSVKPETKFFHVLTLRKIPGDMSFETIRELDLSRCGLTLIELSRFPRLQKLSLKGNSLDGAALQKSQILSLLELSELDVSCNNVQDFNVLVEICRRLRVLRSFYCDRNPCFPANRQDTRIQFLSKLPQMRQLKCPLLLLNGFEIGVAERCASVKEHFKDQNLETFRVDLIFEKMQIDSSDARSMQVVQALNLSYFGITSLMRLRGFTGLVYLDVSFNNLRSLEDKFFANVPNLQHLDIRENDLQEKGAKLLTILGNCRALKFLLMKNSTEDKAFTAKPKIYLRKVCGVLRQLETLDGLPNPFNQAPVSPQLFTENFPAYAFPPGMMPQFPFQPGMAPPGAAEAFYAQQQQFMMQQLQQPQQPQQLQQSQHHPQQMYPPQSYGPPQGMAPLQFEVLATQSLHQGPARNGAMLSPRHIGVSSPVQPSAYDGTNSFGAEGLATRKAKKLGVGVPGINSELKGRLPQSAPSNDTLRAQNAATSPRPGWLAAPAPRTAASNQDFEQSDDSDTESETESESEPSDPESEPEPALDNPDSESESDRDDSVPSKQPSVYEDGDSDDNSFNSNEPVVTAAPTTNGKAHNTNTATAPPSSSTANNNNNNNSDAGKAASAGATSEFRKNPRFARLLTEFGNDLSESEDELDLGDGGNAYWASDSDSDEEEEESDEEDDKKKKPPARRGAAPTNPAAAATTATAAGPKKRTKVSDTAGVDYD